MPMVAMPDSWMEAKGNRPNVSVLYLVSKLSAGLESVTLLIEKFNLSLCVGKSRLLTQSCQLQTARNNTLGRLSDFLGSYRHITSFQLRIATRMGTTLSLIFRRFATKFSNLVQKKNSPGEEPRYEASSRPVCNRGEKFSKMM